jgi:hypothetical protein
VTVYVLGETMRETEKDKKQEKGKKIMEKKDRHTFRKTEINDTGK